MRPKVENTYAKKNNIDQVGCTYALDALSNSPTAGKTRKIDFTAKTAVMEVAAKKCVYTLSGGNSCDSTNKIKKQKIDSMSWLL